MCQFHGLRVSKNNRWLLILISCVLGGATLSATTQQEDERSDLEFVSEEFGFKLAKPDEGWNLQQSTPKPGALMVKVTEEGSGGAIEVTVLAEKSDSPDKSLATQRDEALDRTNGQEQFSNQSKESFQIAGQEVPGLAIDWEISGGLFRVHQGYLKNQGLSYTVAIHGPSDRFDELQEKLEQIRDTIQFVPISNEARTAGKLTRLVAKCGSEVQTAKTWEEASAIARREGKAILIQIRSQPGFDLADAMTTVALMDEYVIDFVNRHCVFFRFDKGMDAPIVSYEKYGIGPSSFGNTVLLAQPDGTVFGDTFSFEPHTFYDFLLTSFKDRVGENKPPSQLKTQPEIASWYAEGGAFTKALEVIEGMENLEAHRVRAQVYRRQRKLRLALKELQAATSHATDANELADLYIDLTVLKLVMRDIDSKRALESFKDLLRENPEHPRKAEVMYVVGLCYFALADAEMAEKTCLELIETFDEDNRWTWQAAAFLKSNAFQLKIPFDFSIPDEEILDALRSVPFEPIDVGEIERAEDEAIAYLLKNQRDDGSWISPAGGTGRKRDLTNHVYDRGYVNLCKIAS